MLMSFYLLNAMEKKDNANEINRRSALKRISAIGAAFTLGTVPSAAAESNQQISYEDLELPYPNTPVTKLHPSIQNVTNHPELLTLPQEAINRHFEASNLKGRKLGKARSYVAKLRNKYPVERIENGTETIIKLAEEAIPKQSRHSKGSASYSKNELKHRRNALSVFSGEGPDIVEAQWDMDHHVSITKALMEDTIGADPTIEYASDDPDEFATIAKGQVDDIAAQIETDSIIEDVTKDAVVGVLKDALGVFHSNWAQYHDPSIASIDFGPLGQVDIPFGLGRAPTSAEVFFSKAINESVRWEGEVKLGYSLHYLEDCAQPLHTGMGMEQAGLDVNGVTNGNIDFFTSAKNWLHRGFEHIVHNNWTSPPSFGGDNLQSHLKGSQSPRIYSPAQAVRDMSSVSSQYSYNIYYTIYNNQNKSQNYWDWSDSTKRTIYENLANCYSTLGYLGRGFVEEFDRDF